MFGFELVNPLRKLAEELPNFSKNDSLEIGKYHWAIRREEESKNNNCIGGATIFVTDIERFEKV